MARSRTGAPEGRPVREPDRGTATDAELVALMTQGDQESLHELYRRHAPWLALRLARRCNDRDLVDDALQDTFMAAWKGAARWRADGHPEAWLWGIAIRRLISRMRARGHRPLQLTEEDLTAAMGSAPSVEEQVLVAVEFGDLAGALSRLSPEMRAVVQARLLDGLSTKEAARLLGLAENTVKSRLSRATERLRNDLMAGWA
jgi:RNA polymerase sigma-70 factor (ECF subfamily)